MIPSIGVVSFKESAQPLLSLFARSSSQEGSSAPPSLRLWTPSFLDHSPSCISQYAFAQHAKLEEFADTPLIVVTLPAIHIRKAFHELGEVVSGRHLIIHTVANVEGATHISPSQVIEEESSVKRLGFLTGPFECESDSIRQPITLCVASEFPEVPEAIRHATKSSGVVIRALQDLPGAEAAARYARVIAFAHGLLTSQEGSRCAAAVLVTDGFREMATYVTACRGYENTTYSLAGLANVQGAICGDGSLDVKMARRLVALQATDIDRVQEWMLEAYREDWREFVSLVQALRERMRRMQIPHPLLEAVHKVVNQGCQLTESLATYWSGAS